MKNYLMIQNNVVTNLCVWDGDVNSWQPPQDVIMLSQDTTPTKIWSVNQEGTDYILVNFVGNANIGFTYEDGFCVTNEPKPEIIDPIIPVTIIEE
jgi:hypothetical protein